MTTNIKHGLLINVIPFAIFSLYSLFMSSLSKGFESARSRPGKCWVIE